MDLPADRQSFDRLVLGHLSAAQRFAVRLTGSLDTAEEVLQEALVRASRSWRTFRGQAKFQTWLFQVVVNAFRDHRSASQSLPVAAGSAEALPDELPDREAVDPARHAATEEGGRLIARAVSSLPPRQREVLVLVAYEGLSTVEVAGLLGLSESNVRANLSFARKRLRELLPREVTENYRDA